MARPKSSSTSSTSVHRARRREGIDELSGHAPVIPGNAHTSTVAHLGGGRLVRRGPRSDRAPTSRACASSPAEWIDEEDAYDATQDESRFLVRDDPYTLTRSADQDRHLRENFGRTFLESIAFMFNRSETAVAYCACQLGLPASSACEGSPKYSTWRRSPPGSAPRLRQPGARCGRLRSRASTSIPAPTAGTRVQTPSSSVCGSTRSRN